MRRVALVLVLAAVPAACGRPMTTSISASGSIVVGPERAGRTVTLETGDKLVVKLGNGRWRLVAYPRRALELRAKDGRAGRFELEAVHRGRGLVHAVDLTRLAGMRWQQCGPLPHPSLDGGNRSPNASRRPCPVKTGEDYLFTVRVRVE